MSVYLVLSFKTFILRIVVSCTSRHKVNILKEMGFILRLN